MEFETLAIPDIKIVRPSKHEDPRGFFSETYNRDTFLEAGIDIEFVQDNHTFSAAAGTIRGLHFQAPPFAQDKLVRVVRGAIFDVAVDLRVGSPSFGRCVSATISAADWTEVLVPVGFAHGFVTLEPHTEVLYKVSNVYAPEHDKGLLWNDPALNIDWPISDVEVSISPKDLVQPRLSELPTYFHYAQRARE